MNTKIRNNQIYISAEYILPKCGLANYLEMIADSFRQYHGEMEIDVKTVNNFWEIQYDLLNEKEIVELSKSFSALSLRKKIRYIIRLLTPVSMRPAGDRIYRKVKAFIKKVIPEKLNDLIVYHLSHHKKNCKFWKNIDDESIVLLPHVPLANAVLPYFNELVKKKLIWIIHDLHPFYFRDAWSEEALKICDNFLPVMAKKAQHIIVHNDFTKKSVIEYLGVTEDKITVIRLPYIIDTELFDNSKDETVLQRYGIIKPYALWASSSTIVHKNHERLINAWYKINYELNIPIQLVCTGSREPNWESIKLLLEKYGAKVNVIFTGTIEKSDLMNILFNAEMAVCPTLFEGGGCGPAMEATMAGIPVACSDIPQIREQYNNRSDLCEFFNPYDCNSIASAVEKIFKNKNAYQKKSYKAMQWLKNNRTWKNVADDYCCVLENCFGRNN